MKNLLLPILLGFSAVLIPTQAADTTFGDFTAGQTFTLRVTKRFTARLKGIDYDKNVAVPKGIPDFSVGDRVKFTIGSDGQLKGPGFIITYRRDEGRYNVYANRPTYHSPKGSAATVYKSLKDKPVKAAVTFDNLKFSGIFPVTTTVNYVFRK